MRTLPTSRLFSRPRPATLLGLAATAVACALSADASAIQIFASDCNFGFQDVYNPGDGVCVSGEMDIVPPGKICADGDVEVTPANNANPFADVTMGGANYILGRAGAGAFFDEEVWPPPLKPGQYELVIDQYPFFGAFGAADYRTGGVAFTVSNAPIVFSVNPAAAPGRTLVSVKVQDPSGNADVARFIGLRGSLGGSTSPRAQCAAGPRPASTTGRTPAAPRR